jgi:hypothetical protein
VVYELGQPGAQQWGTPLSVAGIPAKRSLAVEAEGSGQHLPGGAGDAGWGFHLAPGAGAGQAAGLAAAAAGEATPGALVHGGLGAAVGGLHGAAGGGGGGGDLSSVGSQRNGGRTPTLPAAAGLGGGRYAGYEDSVESKQAGGPLGSAARLPGGVAGGHRHAAAAGARLGPTPLHMSRVSVADLLQGSGGEPGGGQAGLLGRSLSRRDQASINRLAASIHGAGGHAVTPADIHSALSGELLLSCALCIVQCGSCLFVGGVR